MCTHVCNTIQVINNRKKKECKPLKNISNCPFVINHFLNLLLSVLKASGTIYVGNGHQYLKPILKDYSLAAVSIYIKGETPYFRLYETYAIY